MTTPEQTQVRHLAAIDLGSNSFHMLVVRILHDDVQQLFKYKERVRLAEGLDAQKRLSDESIEFGVSVLRNFAEQLKPLDECEVRVVATHTLRVAENRQRFLAAARKVFPYPIEIVSGQEEARLVYLGVNETEHLDGNTLVFDIGGGSTEIAIGSGGEMLIGRSHTMGAVSFTQRFFNDGIDKKAYKRAKIAAMQQLERSIPLFNSQSWDHVRATSGTAQAIISASEGLGYPLNTLTLESLRQIRDHILEQDWDTKIFKNITPERQQVMVGGVAVMEAILEGLNVTEATFSSGALREGVVSEVLSQGGAADRRTRSIDSLLMRYHVDTEHAERVSQSAMRFWDQLAGSWNFTPAFRGFLNYAARVHEVGLNISSSGMHKHSAYIIENSNLPGFGLEHQQLLAALVRLHRKRLRFDILPELQLVSDQEIIGLVLALRLAVVWHINRNPNPPDLPLLHTDGKKLTLQLPANFCEEHPLLFADLEREVDLCAQAKIKLKLESI